MSSQNSTPKIILVTGGGRGLGRNTAISAARSGFDVIITYHSNRDAAAEVVSAIIQLALNLGLQPLAEGIETESQRAFLLGHGCNIGQGFLFSPAVPAPEIDRLYFATVRPAA